MMLHVGDIVFYFTCYDAMNDGSEIAMYVVLWHVQMCPIVLSLNTDLSLYYKQNYRQEMADT
jgi:hypothetical protein